MPDSQTPSLCFLWPRRNSLFSVITVPFWTAIGQLAIPRKAACMQTVAADYSETYFKAPVGTNMNNLTFSWKTGGNISSLAIVLLCQGCLQEKKEGLKLRLKFSNLYALSCHWHKSVFWHLNPSGFISSPTATRGFDMTQCKIQHLYKSQYFLFKHLSL